MNILSLNLLPLLLASLLLIGCATKPLSSVDRTKYRAVAVSPAVKTPDKYFYQNMTGKRARGIGGNFGLVGALVGGAVGADSESKALRRFDAAAGRQKIDIGNVVRSRFVATLKSARMFEVTPGNGDAAFHLEIEAYGLGPVNGEQLGGIIHAKATLIGRDGKTIWERNEVGTSSTSGSLEDFERNHKLWPLVLHEAAEKVSRQLILYTKEGGR
jgi:hypothetical protein